MTGYYIMTQFHPDFVSGDWLEKDSDRPRDNCRSWVLSRECINGGAEMMFRDDGGGRDIILLFSAIL